MKEAQPPQQQPPPPPDATSNNTSTATTTTIAAQRQQKKEDGKRKKRQRIEAAGGIRPRSSASSSASSPGTRKHSHEADDRRSADHEQQRGFTAPVKKSRFENYDHTRGRGGGRGRGGSSVGGRGYMMGNERSGGRFRSGGRGRGREDRGRGRGRGGRGYEGREGGTSNNGRFDRDRNDREGRNDSRDARHHGGRFPSQASYPSEPPSSHRFGRVMEQVPCRQRGRYSTVSIAVPGSVLANCQTKELKTLLVGQLARAATIYHIDEIVVFNDRLGQDNSNTNKGWRDFKRRKQQELNNPTVHAQNRPEETSTAPTTDDPSAKPHEETKTEETAAERPARVPKSTQEEFMARVLQYCECPQYLRKVFFPRHPDLQYAGLLPPMDAPHHVRVEHRSAFREGVVMEYRSKSTNPDGSRNPNSFVNCGIRNRPVEIDRKLTPGIRCTVQLDPHAYGKAAQLKGVVVSPATPREQDGTYWGYTTRLAPSLADVLHGCPFVDPVDDSSDSDSENDEESDTEDDSDLENSSDNATGSDDSEDDGSDGSEEKNTNTTNTTAARKKQVGGYDLKIGTSERGLQSVEDPNFRLLGLSSSSSSSSKKKKNNTNINQTKDTATKKFKHALIVFGGVAGIEECVDADESLKLSGACSSELFDVWLNICPYQGSRTIRTEEAVMIALAQLTPKFLPAMYDYDPTTTRKSGGGSGVAVDNATHDAKEIEFSDEAPSDESSSNEDDDDDDEDEKRENAEKDMKE